MGKLFKVDLLALKSETLTAAIKSAKTSEELIPIVSAYLKLSKEATDVDDFAAAEKAASAAAAHARKSQNLLLVNRAAARVKEIGDLKSKHDKVRKMKETLAANPEDPAANLEVGQYECFTKGNWAVGLPFLAKGADAGFKDLAVRDLAGSTSPADQVQIGDGWWDAAEKRPPGAREELRRRAMTWYEKAVGKLSGLALTKTERRLFELKSEVLGRGTWLDIADPKLYGQNGKIVTLTAGTAVRLTKPPEGEFDGLMVRIKLTAGKASDFRIQYEAKGKALVVYHKDGQVQSAKLEGNTWQSEVMTLCPGKDEYVFHVLINEGEYVGFLDTREFFRIPTPRQALTLPFEMLVFNAKSSDVTLDQIKMRRRQ